MQVAPEGRAMEEAIEESVVGKDVEEGTTVGCSQGLGEAGDTTAMD